MNKFTPEETAEIVRLYVEERQSTRKIGLSLQVRPTFIADLLRAEGAMKGTTAKGWTKMSPGDIDEARRRLSGGESAPSVAKDYGVHAATVRRWCGAPTKKHEGKGHPVVLSDELVAEMGRRWESGESTTALSKEIGLSPQYVWEKLRSAGYKYVHPRVRPDWRYVTPDGYVDVSIPDDHPFAGKMMRRNGSISEHRLVMANALGRPLESFEYVRHRNGDRSDNRIENLQFVLSQPKGAAPRCRECSSMDVEWVDV